MTKHELYCILSIIGLPNALAADERIDKMTDYIKKLADRMTDHSDSDWAMNINHFDWVPGVGLFGIYNAYEETKDKKYLDFLISWADAHIDEAYDMQTVNSTAPLLTIKKLYDITGNEKYLKVCTDVAENLITTAPLTSYGGLEHTVTEDGADFHGQVWADTLFMAGLFLLEMGEKKYVDFAANQFLIHHRKLRADDGLYYHGFNGKDHMSAVKWGRANAWIVYSSAALLEKTDNDEIKKYLVDHINALRKVQRKNGGFGTILDEDASYDELSATAGIIAGIKKAVSIGAVDSSYADMCDTAVITDNINEKGELEKVSTGTPVMPDKGAYMNIPLCPTLYGQGLAILALRKY